MYVRWKKQKRQKKEHGYYFIPNSYHPQHMEKEASLLIAYLAENVRIDGKPKQKIISYLGSINDAKITNLSANEKFWQSVTSHLRTLPLDKDQRKNIEHMLQERIPKVSDREMYKIAELENRHPRHRSHKERDQLEAFRAKHHLPGDDLRTT
jgi:hypothetical protein